MTRSYFLLPDSLSSCPFLEPCCPIFLLIPSPPAGRGVFLSFALNAHTFPLHDTNCSVQEKFPPQRDRTPQGAGMLHCSLVLPPPSASWGGPWCRGWNRIQVLPLTKLGALSSCFIP